REFVGRNERTSGLHVESRFESLISRHASRHQMRLRDSSLSGKRDRLAIAPLHSKREAAKPSILPQLRRIRRGEPGLARCVRRLKIIKTQVLNESIQMHVPARSAEHLVSAERGLGVGAPAKSDEPIRFHLPRLRVVRTECVPTLKRSLYGCD